MKNLYNSIEEALNEYNNLRYIIGNKEYRNRLRKQVFINIVNSFDDSKIDELICLIGEYKPADAQMLIDVYRELKVEKPDIKNRDIVLVGKDDLYKYYGYVLFSNEDYIVVTDVDSLVDILNGEYNEKFKQRGSCRFIGDRFTTEGLIKKMITTINDNPQVIKVVNTEKIKCRPVSDIKKESVDKVRLSCINALLDPIEMLNNNEIREILKNKYKNLVKKLNCKMIEDEMVLNVLDDAIRSYNPGLNQ